MNKDKLKKSLLTTLFFVMAGTVFGQWQQLNGPSGGYIRSIIFDGQTLYAASSGGVLVSGDQGSSWTFRNNGLLSSDTKSFTQLGDYVFVSTDENVFRTNDNGMTWEPAGTELEGKYIKNLTEINNVLFAATYLRGIYASADSGNTWTAVNNGFTAKYAYYFATDGINVFAGTYQDGLYRSADMGNSWIPINNGITELNIVSIICFGGKVFVSTLSSGVFVSSDEGNTWSPLGTSIPSVKGFASLNGVLYAASFGSGVYKSLDIGETWSVINQGLSERHIWSIGTTDSALFVGVTSGHIYKRNSTKGNWTTSSTIEFNASVGSISSSGSNLLAGTHGSGFFASVDAGDSWTKTTSIWTVETRAIISSNQFVFAGTDMLGIFKSTNYGGTFSRSNTGLTSAWIQAFTIYDGKLFAGSGEEGVFVSDDAGSSWNSINTGLGSLNVTSLASDDDNVYAGTSDTGIYFSNDLGLNWAKINTGLNSNKITSIQSFDSYLFAGTKNNGLFKSSNQGVIWQQVSNGLSSQVNIRCIYNYDSLLFVGTGNGEIFTSMNYGNSWTEITNDLYGSPILSLWVYDDFIYAGINAGGVWKMPLSRITKNKEVEGDIILDEDFVISVTTGTIPADESGQIVSYSISPTSIDFATLSFDEQTGEVIISSLPDANGSQQFTITADDGQAPNNTVAQTFMLTVNSINDDPTFTISGDVILDEDFTTVHELTVIPENIPTDEPDQIVSYCISPTSIDFATLSFDELTGEAIVSSLPDTNGSQQFTITADDGQAANNTASLSFMLTVNSINDAPTYEIIEDQVINAGEILQVAISIDDVDKDNITLTASSNDQNIIRDEDLIITKTSDEIFIITLAPYLDNFGQTSINIKIFDGTVDEKGAYNLNILPNEVTGIAEDIFSSTISIFPNPASEILIVQSKTGFDKNTSIIITSISGKEVYSNAIDYQNEIRISLSSLSVGLYTITLFNKNSRITRKIIKR